MTTDSPTADLPKRKRRWFQFSLRTMMIVVTLLAIPCAWLGRRIEQKRDERDAAAEIKKLGGIVLYDYQWQPESVIPADYGAEPRGPNWLRKLLGDNFFSEVASVDMSYYSDARGNVGDAELVHLEQLTQLQWLNLSATKITDFGLVHLEGLTQLRTLDLSGTKISNSGLEHLKDITGLRHLYLRGTSIGDAGLARLECLTQLEWLDLARSQFTESGQPRDQRITDEGLKCLGGLHQLNDLKLDDATDFTDAGIEYLAGLHQLVSLGLERTKITDSGLAQLKRLKNLRQLDLFESTVTDTGVADLRKELPACRIVFRGYPTGNFEPQ